MTQLRYCIGEDIDVLEFDIVLWISVPRGVKKVYMATTYWYYSCFSTLSPLRQILCFAVLTLRFIHEVVGQMRACVMYKCSAYNLLWDLRFESCICN